MPEKFHCSSISQMKHSSFQVVGLHARRIKSSDPGGWVIVSVPDHSALSLVSLKATSLRKTKREVPYKPSSLLTCFFWIPAHCISGGLGDGCGLTSSYSGHPSAPTKSLLTTVPSSYTWSKTLWDCFLPAPVMWWLWLRLVLIFLWCCLCL